VTFPPLTQPKLVLDTPHLTLCRKTTAAAAAAAAVLVPVVEAASSFVFGADVERRTDHARVAEAHRLVQVVDAGEEVAEVTAGGAHHRRVAEPRRVADERPAELGRDLGRDLPRSTRSTQIDRSQPASGRSQPGSTDLSPRSARIGPIHPDRPMSAWTGQISVRIRPNSARNWSGERRLSARTAEQASAMRGSTSSE